MSASRGAQAEAAPEESTPRPTVLPENAAGRNLHQRIAAITGEAKVKFTGRTGEKQGNRPTLSIGDVDEALGDLMARHGITTDYEFIDEPKKLAERSTQGGGVMETWRVHIWGIATNVDDPTDFIRRELWDDGSNVSGAVSFALKRWHRAMFKLAEDDDKADHPQNQPRPARREDFTSPREARHASAAPGSQGSGDGQASAVSGERVPYDQIACPRCGVIGQVFRKRDGSGYFCSGSKGGCGASLSAEEYEAAREAAQKRLEGKEPEEAPQAASAGVGAGERVCPNCGESGHLVLLAEDREVARCAKARGGCGAEFAASTVPTRAEYEAKVGGAAEIPVVDPDEAIRAIDGEDGSKQPSLLEEKLEEAGVAAAGEGRER